MKKREVSAPTHRAHVFYGGRVQGVGFRFTAERLALELDLVGWVRNLPDGRVELLCEGPQDKIKLFFEKIRGGPLGRYIEKTVCQWEKPTREFKDFSVEFFL